MDATGRPTSVTVIAWILIAMAALTMIVTPLSTLMPEVRENYEKLGRSMSVSVAITMVAGMVTLVSGIAMLRGRNWGRMLYVILIPASYAVVLPTYGFSSAQVPGLLFYAVIVVFLTRPAASAFFKGSAPAGPLPTE